MAGVAAAGRSLGAAAIHRVSGSDPSAPIDPEFSAKPLQTIHCHVLKQSLRRLHARAQTPADCILELLQRHAARTTLLVNAPHQLVRRNCRLRNLLSE